MNLKRKIFAVLAATLIMLTATGVAAAMPSGNASCVAHHAVMNEPGHIADVALAGHVSHLARHCMIP